MSERIRVMSHEARKSAHTRGAASDPQMKFEHAASVVSSVVVLETGLGLKAFLRVSVSY